MSHEPSWRKGLRSLCLKKLNDFGGRGTARQIAENTGQPLDLITPRLTELAEMGAIRQSRDKIYSGGRGRPQVVWETVDLAGGADDDCDAPGCNDGCANDVPNWFRRFGN